MRFMARSLAVVVLMTGCTVLAQEAVPNKDSSYLPLKKDSTWTYKVGGNTIVMKVFGPDKVGNEAATRIDTLVNNKVVANEHLVIKEDGIYRVAINGVTPTIPVKIFALPYKAGTSWEVDTKIQNQPIKGKFVTKEETTKVPAGEYKAILIDGPEFEVAGTKTNLKYWFAENVGIIKLQFALGDTSATLELEKYEPGK